MGPIMDNVRKVIEDYRSENGYSFIFDTAQGGFVVAVDKKSRQDGGDSFASQVVCAKGSGGESSWTDDQSCRCDEASTTEVTQAAPNTLSVVGGDGREPVTAAAIAEQVGGVLEGDATVAVSRVAPLDRATTADLSVFSSARYASWYATTNAGVVLVANELREYDTAAITRIVVNKPVLM